MNNKITALLSIAGLSLSLASFGAEKPAIKVMILDGQNNHRWQETTPVLKEILEEAGVFSVDVSTSPAAAKKGTKSDPKKWDGWNPDFSAYDVVLSNYNGEMWPDTVQKNFENFVGNGGGFVVVHAANNSFGKWTEYNRMIGVGGWGGRNEKSGPWIHIENGKIARDESPGRAGSHGPRREFPVVHLEANHPTTRGLPTTWMHCKDELYCKMRGPAVNMEVLGYAYARETKRNEPMIMTLSYGKGRVYHTPLGHDVEAMRCRGFYEMIQRGTEWAATGAVKHTAAVPADFPTADKSTPVK